VRSLYAEREGKWGEQITRELERMVLLRNVDNLWMDHIDAMDELRRGIYLRSFGQRDPVVEYRMEGSDMYDAMIEAIRENTVKMLLTIRLQENADVKREQVAKPTHPGRHLLPPYGQERKSRPKRPLPCGSGKKYKNAAARSIVEQKDPVPRMKGRRVLLHATRVQPPAGEKSQILPRFGKDNQKSPKQLKSNELHKPDGADAAVKARKAVSA
jgi:hypothetical protein